MSKTQRAVEKVLAGMAIRYAAIEEQVTEQAIRRKLKEMKAAEMKADGFCPCCGQKLPEKTT